MALADYAPHRFTVEEYLRMGETGLIPPDARVELIEGEVVDVPPIGPPHGSIVDRFNMTLTRVLRDRAIVRVQGAVVLSDISMPQPDIAVLRPTDDFYFTANPRPDDILLVVEVSASTLRFDSGVKLPLYARSGVAEAWLVDVDARTILVSGDPRDGDYRTRRVVDRTGTVRVLDMDILAADLIG
jgi:Uma2 family endonuclease